MEGTVETEGAFEPPAWAVDPAALGEMALARRADLRARQVAVAEAAANLRLAEANRYGNPTVGPAIAYDPSKVSMVGAQVSVPVPVANTGRGQVFQGAAEHALAAAQLRQAEVDVRRDVAAGLVRLAAAEQRAEQFRTKLLPDLRRAVDDMEKLFQAGEPRGGRAAGDRRAAEAVAGAGRVPGRPVVGPAGAGGRRRRGRRAGAGARSAGAGRAAGPHGGAEAIREGGATLRCSALPDAYYTTSASFCSSTSISASSAALASRSVRSASSLATASPWAFRLSASLRSASIRACSV